MNKIPLAGPYGKHGGTASSWLVYLSTKLVAWQLHIDSVNE